MTIRSFEIQVHDDHLARIAQVRKPILAVAELIWNAVDADADEVSVSLTDGPLGVLESIRVRDDGHGIPYVEAERLFSGLGGSWKQSRHHSKEKHRILHGKEGRGRFRVFALGRVVDWDVCYVSASGLRAYRISMKKDHLKRVEVDDDSPAAADRARGVLVTVTELDRDFRSLRGPGVADELAQIFALYLRQYPTIKINYDGTLIDPRSVEDRTEEYDLPQITTPEGEEFRASIEIVEWKMPTERRLYFCNGNGFPLDDTQPGIQAAGFNFTAYLKSDYFAKLLAENRLEIASLDNPTSKILEAAKETLRSHFRRRASERAAGLVDEWRREAVYPYQGDATSAVEEAERQVKDFRKRMNWH